LNFSLASAIELYSVILFVGQYLGNEIDSEDRGYGLGDSFQELRRNLDEGTFTEGGPMYILNEKNGKMLFSFFFGMIFCRVVLMRIL
jgi:hypothetical protein